MTTIATRYFRIRGRVQGVGFRYATQQEAQRLGLNGWVRNCPDNTVEAEATGDSDLLNALEQWLQHGPPGSKVEQVESSIGDNNVVCDQKSNPAGFQILR